MTPRTSRASSSRPRPGTTSCPRRTRPTTTTRPCATATRTTRSTCSAAIGYSWKDDQGDMTEQAMASASATHVPTGLNLTLATGQQMSDEGQYIYAKVGWSGDVVQFGKTAVSADYYGGSDFGVSGSESSSWGVQAVQQFAEQGLEAYLGYRRIRLRRRGRAPTSRTSARSCSARAGNSDRRLEADKVTREEGTGHAAAADGHTDDATPVAPRLRAARDLRRTRLARGRDAAFRALGPRHRPARGAPQPHDGVGGRAYRATR